MAAYGYTLTVSAGKIPSSQAGFNWLLTEANFPTAAKDGGATSILTGGGNLRCYTDDTKATQLPIDVVVFATGAAPIIQVWGLSPLLDVGSTVYAEADTVATSQPVFSGSYGRNATWADFELVIHGATSMSSTGNHSPTIVGSPSVSSVAFDSGYDLSNNTKYVQIPHAASLNIDKNYSIDFWINPLSSPASGQTYVDKVNSSNTTGFRALTGGTNTIRSRHPTLTASNLTNADISTATKRLSFDMDGTVRQNIINGVSLGSDSPTGTVTNNNEDLFIGHCLSTLSDSFEGVLGGFWLSKSSRSVAKKLGEFNNQSDPSAFFSASAWVEQGSGGISLTATLGTIEYNSNDTAISLTGSVDVVTTLGAISYSSNDTSVGLFGVVDVTATLGTINYDSNDTLISVFGNVDVIATLGTINYYSNDTSIGLSSVVEIDATLGTINYLSNDSVITLQGQVALIATLGTISYDSYNVNVQVGTGQIIGNVTAGFANNIYLSSFKPSTITVNFKS